MVYVERDSYAAAALVARMEDASLDRAPVFDDLATFPGASFRGKVDCVLAGVPCQPFSVAGQQRGTEDERWLWPLAWRIVRDTGAWALVLENVRGFYGAGLRPVLRDLAESGWIAEWSNLRASDVGASHKRDRLFLVAVADGYGDRLESIRRRWRGRLVLKGILDAADARRARELGIDGVIVSNHGGRQLDGAVAPLRVLPGIVAEAGAMTVMLDGGVRRGTHVLKALALGASFVFVGRPFFFAAAVGGQPGVAHAIRLLRDEIDRDMALLGITSLAEMTRERIVSSL